MVVLLAFLTVSVLASISLNPEELLQLMPLYLVFIFGTCVYYPDIPFVFCFSVWLFILAADQLSEWLSIIQFYKSVLNGDSVMNKIRYGET
jgi:hypothetical protein